VDLEVTAPLAGTAVPLAEVPDPVFADALVGPGVAIVPRPGPCTVVAPIDGTLVKVKPHAFVVVSADGRGVLVHLGIDTVTLGGDGFRVLVVEGATIAIGDPVVEWDPAAVEARGLSAICPVVALDATAVAAAARGPVRPGESLFTWASRAR
jgi:PTS system glucose-specific IIA component